VENGLIPPETLAIDFLHELESRPAVADPLHQVAQRIVGVVVSIANCDSCFVYMLESGHLVLRASKNPHPEHIDRLKLPLGQGITGWVAAQRKPVAVGAKAWADPRFRSFTELPEDRYEAFLSVPILCHNRLVGVINLQHKQPHAHSAHEILLISTIGFLVGAEIEMARLEEQYLQISGELETKKIVERATALLQRDMQISEEDAYIALQTQSRQRHMAMKEVAAAIVMSEEIKRKPETDEKLTATDALNPGSR
jgi:signal transduction protein with GAF and PtsI domain